jgi:erythritol transport system permease protein
MSSLANRIRQGGIPALGSLLLRFRALVALILIMALFSFVSNSFLTTSNLVTVLVQSSINGLLAVGMTFVIVSGGIDLSVGAIMAVAGMAVGALIDVGVRLPVFGVIIYFHTWMVALLGIAVGALIGAVNGFVITRMKVAPFIATLGMLYVARGIALLSNNGSTFPFLDGHGELGNTGFPLLGSGLIVGIPVPILLLAAVAVAGSFVANRTVFGRHVYAVGGNERAAALSGARVSVVRLKVYILSGALAALAGLIVAAQLDAAEPAAGTGYELNAIAATVLGGTSLMGGRGTISGSIIGALVIAVLVDGLILRGVSDFWQMIITGVVIVIAVAIDQPQFKFPIFRNRVGKGGEDPTPRK